jgi:hypothetical protein
MGKPRMLLFAAAAAAALTAAALIVPTLGAQPADGAIANFTPGSVKLYHTGGTVPSSGYSDVGRLTIPSGAYLLTAHAVIASDAATATGVECFLVYPGTQDDPYALTPDLMSVPPGTQNVAASLTLGAKSGDNSTQDISLQAVTTSTSGGNVDLLCRVLEPGADRLVWAQDISVVAVSVAGATVTDNAPPAPGTY